MAMTPDGKTIYVTEGLNSVTPVSTVTNTAGKPIKIGGPVTPIRIGDTIHFGGPITAIAVTP
jgi:DNA-binding beta-propeller fold protein YncE